MLVMSAPAWAVAGQSGAPAGQDAASRVHIEQARIPQPPPGAQVAAAYFTLRNVGGTTAVLTGVESPLAGGAMLHESLQRHGEMLMRARSELPIAPGQSVTLSPGGLHVMLHGLAHPLHVGEKVPLMLHFADGSSLTTAAAVRPLGSP
jgi:copper(I)-binding protein